VSTTGRQTNPTSSSCAPPVDSQRTGFSGNGQFVGNLALLKRTRGRKNCEIGLLTSAREPVLSLSQTWHGRLVNGNPIPACPRGILRGGGCTALIGRSMFWALKNGKTSLTVWAYSSALASRKIDFASPMSGCLAERRTTARPKGNQPSIHPETRLRVSC
jgi:hypothetical protein